MSILGQAVTTGEQHGNCSITSSYSWFASHSIVCRTSLFLRPQTLLVQLLQATTCIFKEVHAKLLKRFTLAGPLCKSPAWNTELSLSVIFPSQKTSYDTLRSPKCPKQQAAFPQGFHTSPPFCYEGCTWLLLPLAPIIIKRLPLQHKAGINEGPNTYIKQQ